MVPGLLFFVALGAAFVPWTTSRLGRRPLLAGLVLGVALSVLGAALALPLFPWTDLLVLLVALTGGILLGRGLPERASYLFLILVLLSVLDVVQFALTSGTPSPGGSTSTGPSPLDYLNFSIPPPVGRFNLGIFDILILAMLSEWWRLRESSPLVAQVPGLTGFALADLFVLATAYGALPLIPFLTLGWLISETAWRLLRRFRPSMVSG